LLAVLSLALWLFALVLYLPLIAAIGPPLLRQHDPARLSPDWWITMGALAISTVVAGRVYVALDGPDALRWAVLGCWTCATLWMPVLAVVELRRSRGGLPAWRFQPAGWSMVFPLGMYALASHTTGVLFGLHALTSLSVVFFCLALAAWIAVASTALQPRRRCG
jgi:tellurite resistance protein TehA-like permease